MRPSRLPAAMLIAVLALVPIAGCSQAPGRTALPQPGQKLQRPERLRLGLTRTEDALPLWAARQQGVFDKIGVPVELVTFDSPEERDEAFRAGDINAYVGDVVSVVRLREQGAASRIVTVCLGVTRTQGRVGIVSAPGSGIVKAEQLKSVPIATSSGTMEEFVVDRLLMRSLGVWGENKSYIDDPAQRLAAITSRMIPAAVLPEPYLTLAVRRHAHLILSDTRGENLSQTVLAVSDRVLSRPAGVSAVQKLLGAWDAGSIMVNTKRAQYRPLLVTMARFPDAVMKRYRMNKYPYHELPTDLQIAAVSRWMVKRKLLRSAPAYTDITWHP